MNCFFIQFLSNFEQCHQCFLLDDLSAPPYLLESLQAVLDMLHIAFVLAVVRQLILEFLHLSHPEIIITET